MNVRTDAEIKITITAGKHEKAVIKNFIGCLLEENLCCNLTIEQLGKLIENGTLHTGTAKNDRYQKVRPEIVIRVEENATEEIDFGMENVIREFIVANRGQKTINREVTNKWLADIRSKFDSYMTRAFWGVCLEEGVKVRSNCGKYSKVKSDTEEVRSSKNKAVEDCPLESPEECPLKTA